MRRRGGAGGGEERGSGDDADARAAAPDPPPPKPTSGTSQKPASGAPASDTYYATRIAIVRLLNAVYLIAFAVGFHQLLPLVGSRGLLPARLYMERMRSGYCGATCAWEVPSLFWFVPEADLDSAMRVACASGAAVAAIGVVTGASNFFLMMALWVLYTSIRNIGQAFYGFGWEIQVAPLSACVAARCRRAGTPPQLTETGFLAAFLCPLFSLRPAPRSSPPSRPVIWLFRWLAFRIMLGAGLIKIRSHDTCWRDLTCLDYHFETQPIPNPLSWYVHQLPHAFQAFQVLVNHVVELALPFLAMLPYPLPRRLRRPLRLACGAAFAHFMLGIIISGNYSFLNWLTIVPCLAFFDDAFLLGGSGYRPWLFFCFLLPGEFAAAKAAASSPPMKGRLRTPIRAARDLVLVALIAYLSRGPVHNLFFADQQVMNTSFDKFALVNTYGAFGTVGKQRPEVVLLGTNDTHIGPGTVWREYEFKCKPGSVGRRPPPLCSSLTAAPPPAPPTPTPPPPPKVWFAAMSSYQQHPWLVALAAKFLRGDEGARSLVAGDPFEGASPPAFVKDGGARRRRCAATARRTEMRSTWMDGADLYLYRFTRWGSPEAQAGAWWVRERLREYLPPVSLDNPSLRAYLAQLGWQPPDFAPLR
eukprot:tig00000189_g14338.t1